MNPILLEIIGYTASVLVAVSLMMSSILRLRIINLLGSFTFTIYGVLIAAYPVAAVNLFIVFINIYYLRRMLRPQEYFRLLEVEAESDYLKYFLNFHFDEIRRFFPDYDPQENQPDVALFVLRDMVPAGLLLGDIRGATLQVRLDFVIPQYRDFKIGRYLFDEQAEYFSTRGVNEILSSPGSKEHSAYLRRMGFQPADTSRSENAQYRLRLG